MPAWIVAMLATPDEPPTPLARYTKACGLFYGATGLFLYAFPGGLSSAGAADPLQGQEAGLIRVLGMTLAVVGWFYWMGGRTNADSFGLGTVADRLLVPVFLLPLAATGAVDPGLIVPIAILDPLLGLGALLIWSRTR